MMLEFEKEGEASFIFGGEESFGYLPVDFVRDKDAVSSCYFFAEMTDWLLGKNMSLGEFLDEIYVKYGLYLEDLYSLTLKGIEGSRKIVAIMENFRKFPPSEFCGIKVVGVQDIKNLVTKNLIAGTEETITYLPSSNVLQFILYDGSKITMRPSGTEPKIKFYFSVRESVDGGTISEGKIIIKKKLETLKQDLLRHIQAV
jgi:phosphoglucomutase